MELTSPPPCPTAVTVRRNPPRRARPTPYTTTQPPQSHPPPKTPTPSSAIRSFPINDILSITIPNETSKPPIEDSEKLKVFLRIRPILVTQNVNNNNNTKAVKKNVWPKERKKDVVVVGNGRKRKENEICLRVNDHHSVTLNPPTSVAEVRRTKSEVYQGFSYVFAPEASQNEVYEKMVNPLVEDVLKGKSGMLAAMGPSGSGKTHTVFGSARDPGMVSLALRQIFSEKESSGSKRSRTFYLSIFEIYSERGKGERIMDLSPDGGDLSMQQSTVKGLQEIVINDVQQAETFIASGMLKRSTAMTNSNLQSSRSQCIINIRCENFDEDAAAQSSTAMLTIVDLAGAEREKRTNNQGTRLVESNFINNTSMVFGLCLRSLLEHQKNRKKPLHKHFQNSLLTKYLRDFLQGKKRMALILTAKSGDEDYQDTSYLLRQAAPYMNIKFENVEEQPANTFGNKRRTQILSKTDQVKRMKLNSNGVCTDDEVRSDILHQPNKELIPKKDEDAEFNGSSAECPVIIDAESDFDKSLSENATNLSKTARENQILLKFSRALWNVLKEYKSKLDADVDEVSSLRHSLTAEKERCSVIETELNLMKASCSCGKEAVAEVEENGSKAKLADCLVELDRCQPIDFLESNAKVSSSHAAILEISADTVDAQVSCSNLCEEDVDSGLVSGLNGTSFVEVVSTSLSVQNVEERSNEEENVSVEYVLFDKEDLKGLADLDLSCEIADTVTDLVKAVSVSSVLEMSEEKSNEKFGDSSPKVVFDKQEFNKVQERQVDGEITDLAGLGSELSSVVGDEASSTLEEDKPEEEEKQVTRSVEVISISSEVEKCVDHSIKEINESSPNVVFDKQEFSEAEDMEADGEITGCDSLHSAGLGSELPFVVDGEVSSILEEDILESTINAQVTGSVEVTSTSSEEEKFVEQSNTEIDEPSPNALLDEKEFTEVEEREANGERSGFDSLASAGQGSEFLPVVGDESSSTFEEDKPEKNEKEVPGSVEDISVSNELALFEEQSNKKIDELSPNVVLVKQEVKEAEARVTDGERTGCDGSDTAARGSELPSVDTEEIFNTLEEEKSVHEKEVNVVISSSNLEGSNCVGGNKHLLDTEVPDQQLVLPGDVISSQKSNASKPCQSNPSKPKRRLRPASSVMLRNINILEFDDATEMPKQNHGKRGEKEDIGKKRTQGNISLLRLLKQNLHH